MLVAADLPRLHRWLNDGPVLQWYARRPHTLDEVTARYLHGDEPTAHYVVIVEDEPAGMIQKYRIEDYPEYARAIGAESGWWGIDYLIGEARLRGRGLAPGMITTFLAQHVPGDCVCGPDPKNTASIKTLERAGFHYLRTVAVEGDLEYLMIRPSGTATRAGLPC